MGISIMTILTKDYNGEEPISPLERLIDSILDNTSLEYSSGLSSGTMDTMVCPYCGASTWDRDAGINGVSHADDCSYKLALAFQKYI